MRLDRAVHHRQVLAVVEGVEHGHFQRRAQGDRGLARLQVDLHAVAFGEGFQARAEGIQRVAFASEVNTATQAYPLHLLEQMAEALLDMGQHLVEQLETAVLAVVVEHEAGDLADHRLDLRRVVLAQAAVRTGRVGEDESELLTPGFTRRPRT